jgi:N-glycosylase/DNA lyase
MKSSQKLQDLYSHYNKHKSTIISRLDEFKNVTGERALFQELCFCLLAANTSSKMASRVMANVGEVIFTGSEEEIRIKLKALSCRFYNRRSHYIYCAQNIQIKLDRDYLVKNVKGFGYKEASHYLRNIGVSGLAILDKHVLRAMQEFEVIEDLPKSLNKIRYLDYEKKLISWANELRIPVDHFDFVLWSRKGDEILK